MPGSDDTLKYTRHTKVSHIIYHSLCYNMYIIIFSRFLAADKLVLFNDFFKLFIWEFLFYLKELKDIWNIHKFKFFLISI